MNRIAVFLILMAFNLNFLKAQSADDIMRFSRTSVVGTSRHVGMGGAFGALGGDASAVTNNPGAIGVFRRGEITISPQFFAINNDVEFYGTSTTDVKNNFNFSNLAYVGQLMKNENNKDGWVSVNYGITYTRTNNFHNDNTFRGFNHQSSLLDVYLNQADGLSPSEFDDFGLGLAWDAFLIDIDTINNVYYSQIPFGGINQSRVERSSGRMAETGFSIGGNYANKLYIGASINFTNVFFNRETIFSENVPSDSVLIPVEDWSLNEQLNIDGRGTNFRIGAIFRANDWLRVGASYHSPTFFNLNDEYSTRISANYGNNDVLTSNSGINRFQYRLNTPSRLMGSLGFVLMQRALLNIDYEFVNYRNARLSSQRFSFDDVNRDVRDNYRNAANIRIGGEYMLTSEIGLRAGYAFHGSPIVTNAREDFSINNLSIGAGYRTSSFFLDLAYQYTFTSFLENPYDENLVQAARFSRTTSAVMATLGFRFD